MRRLLVTAVCCVTVLLGAGCADSDAGRSDATTDATADARADATADATASPAATASGGTTPSSGPQGNTRQVCTEAKKINASFAGQVSAKLDQAFADAKAGNEAKAEKGINEATALTRDWIGKLQAQSAKATDPGLRTGLNSLITALKRIVSGEAKTRELEATLKNPNAALSKYCG